MLNNNLFFLVVVAIFVAAAAGYLGSFMVIKRMSLVGDALSHVALPGIAIALVLGIYPMLGALVAMSLVIWGVWYLEEHSKIYPEALVGVFFTTSLALGILITPEPDILEVLFGSIDRISMFEGIVAILISFLVILIVFFLSKKIMLGIISEDLAKSLEIKTKLVNLIYLFLVGVVVALGVKFVGTLLMGALVIIPAASAKNISQDLLSYGIFSVVFGVISAVLGVIGSVVFSIAVGPAVVLVSVILFIFSYVGSYF